MTNPYRAFARAVIAAEREACAQICDKQYERARTSTGAARADACATAIRARVLLAQPEPEGLTGEEIPDNYVGHEKGFAQEHLARLMRDAIGTETNHNAYIVAAGKILDRPEFACVARWGHPTPQPPVDGEVAELAVLLRAEADDTDEQWLRPDQLRRAADLLERLTSDNAGLVAAADSLWADNISLLDGEVAG